MTTTKIAVPQYTQGIQRFFISATVKDGIIKHRWIEHKKNKSYIWKILLSQVCRAKKYGKKV